MAERKAEHTDTTVESKAIPNCDLETIVNLSLLPLDSFAWIIGHSGYLGQNEEGGNAIEFTGDVLAYLFDHVRNDLQTNLRAAWKAAQEGREVEDKELVGRFYNR